jgi:NTP pyrophosphatase (non-canonical NTP hydrolase)
MTVGELCKRSYETADVKGWHEDSRSLGKVIALMHSEVSEALECWRDPARELSQIWYSNTKYGDKPEGFVIELADLLIRIGDTAVEMEIPVAEVLNDVLIVRLGEKQEISVGIPDSLSLIHYYLSQAFGVVFGEFCLVASGLVKAIAKVMMVVGAICRKHNLDLEQAVLLKMDYNDKRPHRHGDKRG